MQPKAPIPVKYFVGALFTAADLLKTAVSKLELHFGTIDLVSTEFPFDQTDYYIPEMGSPIKRQFFSFSRLLPSEWLAQAKLTTNAIEEHLSVDGHRKVNLDIGYLDLDKVVLASAKYCIHKIHLTAGIYADLALHYAKGQFTPYPWAFLDFKTGEYTSFFLKMRTIYKQQLRAYH